MEFTILGNGSASPHAERHPSAAIVSIENTLILIDCGEGTQYRLLEYKVKVNRIKYILISHLHGDHFYGLIALISTMNMHKRSEPLTIFGPMGLKEILSLQLYYSDSKLNYSIDFQDIKPEFPSIILDEKHISISTFPLKHRITCNGFKIIEKKNKRKLNIEKIPKDLPNSMRSLLVNGLDIEDPSLEIIMKNIDYTLDPDPEKSLGYCSDTIFDEDIVKHIEGVDLLYHEATFTEELSSRAKITYHSTAKEAAIIAAMAKVKTLVIGHFSSRYKTLEAFESESKLVFPKTYMAEKGKNFII